jgi:hypothetical protein
MFEPIKGSGMTLPREMQTSLGDWEITYILETLSNEKARLLQINQTAEDEDASADAGNDYIELAGFYKRLEAEAVAVFGEQIKNFSRELL